MANKEKRADDIRKMGPLMMKTRQAFGMCNATGRIDTMQEMFPISSCGTK
jgi:hypothetical protein